MTPHTGRRKGQPVGSLIVEFQRGRIGRIRLATGWRNDARGRDRLERLQVLLADLYTEGRDDLLVALKGRAFTVRDLWLASKEGKLSRLPTLATVRRLVPTLEEFLEQTPNAHTKASRATTLGQLTASRPDATMQDLPGLVREAREECRRDGRASWWNHLRTNAQALARYALGRRHPVYEALSELEPLKETPKQVKRPLTPVEARHVCRQLGELGPVFWAMCLTGMGPGELWGQWREESPGVLFIDGTKTNHRKRRVPLVEPIARPVGDVRALRYALERATPRVMPYDARRSFANWLEAAGIPRTRRRLFLGHAEQDQTDTYERHEVIAYLAEDRAKLAAYLGTDAGPALKVAT